MLDCRCPNCGNEQTQSVQVLVAGGTTHGAIQGGSVSYSQGDNLGGSAFSGKTKSQTQLAAKFVMPKRPSSRSGLLLSGILLTLIGIINFSASKGEAAGCGVVALFIGAGLIVGFISDQRSLPRRQANWDHRANYLSRAWFCHRCGHDWAPEA